jgi:hypothetical protein
MRRIVLFSLFALLVSGCASSGERERVPRGSADRISLAEIEATSLSNAFDLVERLRPAWLRSRGQASLQGGGSTEPVVYFENTRMGGLSALRGIDARSVGEIRLIRAADATTRWGTGHVGGVIQVIARTGP